MQPVHFDPSRPLVATSSFDAGGRRIAAGEVFDWRALGMSVVDVVPLVQHRLLEHDSPAPSPTAPPPSSQRTSQEAQAPSPSSRSHKRRR